jgi:magnesium-transporting ATPase (P-type)
VSTKLRKIGMICVLLTILVLFFRFIIQRFVDKSMSKSEENGVIVTDDSSVGYYFKEIIRYIIMGLSIMIVALPEGLPLAALIACSYSFRKMVTDNSLAKNVSACETLGYVDTIVTEKTGILTMN